MWDKQSIRSSAGIVYSVAHFVGSPCSDRCSQGSALPRFTLGSTLPSASRTEFVRLLCLDSVTDHTYSPVTVNNSVAAKYNQIRLGYNGW